MTKEELVAQDSILQYFEYAHLPERLQVISKPFCDLAFNIAENRPRNPERTVGRKLLECKDAIVRCALSK